MRRRRKTRYTWFPLVGSAANVEGTSSFNQLKALFSPPGNGEPVVAIAPLVTDVPLEGTDISSGNTLGQILGNEYFLKRIVGRCWVSVRQLADDPPVVINPKTFLIGAGMFVARANDSASGGGENQPVGSASAQERLDNYSTLSLDTVREPWFWERKWVLNTGQGPQPQIASTSPIHFGNQFDTPTSNIMLTGMNGAHFDAKTARRIRQDERIWLSLSVRTIDNEFDPPAAPNVAANNGVAVLFDYRVLGALRRARNRSTF